jgi:hypothetical protein
VRYGRVLDHIRKRQIGGTRNHAVVLWNFGLLFEMHEIASLMVSLIIIPISHNALFHLFG